MRTKLPAKDSQPNISAEEFRYDIALNDIRENFAATRQRPRSGDKVRPMGLYALLYDPLQHAYAHQTAVLARGTIGWGSLVQANERLFAPQSKRRPANTIFSDDKSIDSNPDKLSEIAAALFETKHASNVPLETREFSKRLRNETTRSFNLKLPREITDGIDIWFTTNIIDPRHVPGGYLGHNIIPIIFGLGYEVSTIVPHWYWPRSFKTHVWGYSET